MIRSTKPNCTRWDQQADIDDEVLPDDQDHQNPSFSVSGFLNSTLSDFLRTVRTVIMVCGETNGKPEAEWPKCGCIRDTTGITDEHV